MLVCSLYIVYGTWLQHDIIAGNSSPVAQISMLWVYGVSYLTGDRDRDHLRRPTWSGCSSAWSTRTS